MTAPDVQAREGRAERDGCSCPAWVVRCAHFEGRIVLLSGTEGAPTNTIHGTFFGYCVASGSLGLITCKLCGFNHYIEGPGSSRTFDEYDAALEAFARAEAELLAGEQ